MKERYPDKDKFSSIQISEITGKRHGNVMKDIERVLRSAGIPDHNFDDWYEWTTVDYKNGRQRDVFIFNLPFYEACLVLSSYPDYRPAVLNATNLMTLRQLLNDLDVEDLPRDRFVYVAMEEKTGRYKVGISKDPEARIKHLNIGNPEQLILKHAYLATESGNLSEKLAHETLAFNHLRSEWFDAGADLASLPSYGA